jgi:hypothetical protein
MKCLALDFGQLTGWAVRADDGSITSGTATFKIDRWQGGGMRFLRFKQWLTEIRNVSGGFDLVARHSDYDWLILSQFRMGKSFGSTRIWMVRATPC